MKKCNKLIRESAKIKSQAQNLEKSVEKQVKKSKDKSRMILLLREKNTRLRKKLGAEQKKFDQYESILEGNIELKEEILALEDQC
jgi:predicted  nucleic acid-binding Zn-ribbon protein